MKTVTKACFQGDVMFLRVAAIPKEAVKQTTNVVAHSETGHHHVIDAPAKVWSFLTVDPMTGYIECSAPVDIVHQRPFDTHETVRLSEGCWKVRRQREWTPEGWAMVAD